jgi:cytochrome c oxidase subunit 1
MFGGILGFCLSILLKVDLSKPGIINSISTRYFSVITFHGLVMIFVLIMPMLIGFFGNVLIPISQGSIDLLLPRINNLSINILIFSLQFILVAFFIDGGLYCG